MRLLGSNLLPFSVAQLPATWSTGIEVEAYFFEGNIPDDLSQYFLDQRKLIENSVAVSRIVLQPTTEGLMFHQAYSHGVKAVAGSVYDPKLGVTIHYPKNIIPRRTTASSSAMDIDAAYAVDLMTGNKKLKQHLSLSLFPGFPINAVRTLSDFIGNTSGQFATVCDLVFDGLKVFDGALSDTPDKSVQTVLTIAAQGSAEGSTTIGTSSALSVPANVATNAATTPISSDIIRCTGTSATRRLLPVSIGDKSTTPVTKNIGHAILVIPDSNNGALAVGNYDIRLMATKVGVKGSGELIEVESLSVSTGEFVEVIQVRTAISTYIPDGSELDWISMNALFAFNSSRFSSSPSTDFKGVPFTFSQVTMQPDKSIKLLKGSNINIAAANMTFDPTQSFWIEVEYRQDDISSLAETVLYGRYKSFDDRIVIAIDRSNETGLVIWNNAQPAKIARPLSAYAALLSTSFVKLLYEYDADTFTHRISVNGKVVDTFTYKVLAVSSYGTYFSGGYGAAVVPACYWRNYQLVTGKKK